MIKPKQVIGRLIAAVLVTVLVIGLVFSSSSRVQAQAIHGTWWPVQSVDTMKYSRDLAKSKISDLTFDSEIDTQVKNIAATGATHVAIGTPYDEEFFPFLSHWVAAARTYKLKVWFRGNWAGWEGWFGHPRISREEHIKKTVDFIQQHRDLFKDGDIFTPCPECENGGPGDPRHTGDLDAYRQFVISEYKAVSEAFRKNHVQVPVYGSSNADVTRLVMDKPTTAAVGGIIVIDHYVVTPDQLVADIKDIAESSGGQVVLGEFGVPIPDINGDMTEVEQADWLDSALNKLTEVPQLVGLNYWVNMGGSTHLWSDQDSPRLGVSVLTRYFHPEQYSGWIKNSLNQPIKNARISYRNHDYSTDSQGVFHLPIVEPPQQIIISAPGYNDQGVLLVSTLEIPNIVLTKTHPNLLYKLLDLILRMSRNIIH